MVYIILLLLVIVFAIQYPNMNYRQKRISWGVTFIYTTCISAIQYKMGADIPAYMGEFDYYEIDYSFDYIFSFIRRQPLWVLLNVVCKSVIEDFALLKILQAFVVNFIVFRFISKHTNNRMLGVLLYLILFYFHLNFNALRASFALVVFLCAYDYLVEKKLLRYYALCVVAFLFHESALILFLLPLLHPIKKMFGSTDKLLKYVLILGVVSIFLAPIVQSTFGSVLQYLQLMNVISYGDTYLDNSSYSGFRLSIVGSVEYLVKLALYIYLFKKSRCSQSIFGFIFIVYMIIFCLNIAFPIFYRFNDYFCIIFICCLSNGLSNIGFKGLSAKSIYANLVFFVVFFLNTYSYFLKLSDGTREIDQFYPYYTIFEKKTSIIRENNWGHKENDAIYLLRR